MNTVAMARFGVLAVLAATGAQAETSYDKDGILFEGAIRLAAHIGPFGNGSVLLAEDPVAVLLAVPDEARRPADFASPYPLQRSRPAGLAAGAALPVRVTVWVAKKW